jgi:hypothetical protein
MKPTRVAKLENALASRDPISRVRELMPDNGTSVQAVVSYACQCIEEMKQDTGLWEALQGQGPLDLRHLCVGPVSRACHPVRFERRGGAVERARETGNHHPRVLHTSDGCRERSPLLAAEEGYIPFF